MRILLLCDAGAEDACAKEAALFLKVERTGPGYVIATAKNAKAAALVAYHAQIALDVLLFIGEGELKKVVTTVDWKEPVLAKIIKSQENFALRAYHTLGLELNDQELEAEIGAMIKDKINKKVNLDCPKLLFIVAVTEKKALLGLSLVGRELRKRDYRIFTSNRSLRATVAAAALRLAGYTGKEALLLPMEDDGTLTIEAAMMATHRSPFRYRRELALTKYWPSAEGWFRTADAVEIEPKHKPTAVVPSVQFLKSIQKNAKIAGVHKQLEVTKAEMEWLDTKFDKGTFDIIIAQLPCSGKKRKEKEAIQFADDLAYQARYVMKPNATVAVLTQKPDEHAQPFFKHKYSEIGRHKLMMGEQKMVLILFKGK